MHRDLKPENIFVETRDPLQIKLADFGLAKEELSLKTICGTYTYLAPEVAQYSLSARVPNEKYTNSVDIWSVGVVILRFGYGLPGNSGGAIGSQWCRKIVEEASDWESEHMIDFLRRCMIVWRPEPRYSASACLDIIRRLSDPGHRSPTPIPSAYFKGRERTTVGYRADRHRVDVSNTENFHFAWSIKS